MIAGENKKGKRFTIATPTKCGTTSLEALAHRLGRAAGGFEPEFRIMDWDRPRRQHRMALPPRYDPMTGKFGEDYGEWGDARRFIITRNPYRRYMSVFEYLRAPANYSQWGAARVQGWDWPGESETKRVNRDPMNFGDFLLWLADERENPDWGTWGKRRDSLAVGRAYRSPWVWTDPLDFSREALDAQPGGGKTVVLWMERLWGEDGTMAALVRKYGLGIELPSRPPHSNRSKASSTPPQEYWGTWPHSKRVYNGRGEFRPFRSAFVQGCDCPPCRIGVHTEAATLAYV
jgi:hypothetical protein